MRETMSQNPRWKASQEQHVTLTSGFTYNYVQMYTNVQKHVFTPTNKKTIKGLEFLWGREETQMANKQMQMQIKTTMRCSFTLLKNSYENFKNYKGWPIYRETRNPIYYDENVKHFGTECSSSWKTTELRYKQQFYHTHQYSKELKTKIQQILYFFFSFVFKCLLIYCIWMSAL